MYNVMVALLGCPQLNSTSVITSVIHSCYTRNHSAACQIENYSENIITEVANETSTRPVEKKDLYDASVLN